MNPVPATLGVLLLALAIFQTKTGRTFPKANSNSEKAWMILALYIFAAILIGASAVGR